MNFIIENFKKPKTILIILGLTAVIVFSVMLIGYESYLSGLIVGPGTPVCTENDGGKNYYQKGTITLSDGTKLTDYCMTGGYKDNVMEYYCATNGHGMTNFKCPNSCANGACVRETTPPPPTCTDSDGGKNYYQKGHCTDSDGASVQDQCYNGKLYEVYCTATGCGGSINPYECPSGYKCANGACVKTAEPEPKCEADGKCKYPGCPNGDPDCACSQQSGNICQANETCSGTSLTHSGTDTCCSVACAPAAVYSISGKVLKDNSGLSGITINLTGTSSTSTATDSSGSYSFVSLTNGSYTITPFDNNYIFAPISHTITIPKGCATTNMNNINFTAISDLCKQYFEVQDENSAPIAGAEIFTQGAFPEISGGPACDTNNNGRCYIEFRRIEKNHTAEAKKDGYECYNNECRRTFDGCLTEAIVLKLKKPAADFQTADLDCDGIVGAGDIAIVLKWWDKNPSGFACCQTPDIDGDGTANAGDYAIILSQWTFDTF